MARPSSARSALQVRRRYLRRNPLLSTPRLALRVFDNPKALYNLRRIPKVLIPSFIGENTYFPSTPFALHWFNFPILRYYVEKLVLGGYTLSRRITHD